MRKATIHNTLKHVPKLLAFYIYVYRLKFCNFCYYASIFKTKLEICGINVLFNNIITFSPFNSDDFGDVKVMYNDIDFI